MGAHSDKRDRLLRIGIVDPPVDKQREVGADPGINIYWITYHGLVLGFILESQAAASMAITSSSVICGKSM